MFSPLIKLIKLYLGGGFGGGGVWKRFIEPDFKKYKLNNDSWWLPNQVYNASGLWEVYSFCKG